MLSMYRQENAHLVSSDVGFASQPFAPWPNGLLWLDLLHPTRDENRHVEQALGLSIPTHEEAQDIEVSARLYHEDGAEFMTMTALAHLDSDAAGDDAHHFRSERRCARDHPLRRAEGVPDLRRARAKGRDGVLQRRRGRHARSGRDPDRAHGRHPRTGRPRSRTSLPRNFPAKDDERQERSEPGFPVGHRSARCRGRFARDGAREPRQPEPHASLSHRHRQGVARPQQGRRRLGRRLDPRRDRAQRSRQLSHQQDQFPARRHARIDQSRTEPDHQAVFDRRRGAVAANAGCQRSTA